MLGKEGDRPGRSKAKKGKKKKDEPSVDSPRPLGMPPDYPSTEVSCFLSVLLIPPANKALGDGCV